ncbi:hypothetical protein vBEcoMWL3_gp140c [Escherichia phage vB_EcoM_WL-3]|nr:hypothetical protein vBEcoMWL3_gp140c [Escherichia phage vB_EcoM_WL-3]
MTYTLEVLGCVTPPCVSYGFLISVCSVIGSPATRTAIPPVNTLLCVAFTTVGGHASWPAVTHLS